MTRISCVRCFVWSRKVFLVTDHTPEMHRDVEELPSILTEIKQSGHIIDSHKCVRCSDYSDTWHIFSDSLFSMQESLTGDLVRLIGVLDDLEELGDIMGEMLNDQEEVEVRLFFLLSKCSICRIYLHSSSAKRVWIPFMNKSWQSEIYMNDTSPIKRLSISW